MASSDPSLKKRASTSRLPSLSTSAYEAETEQDGEVGHESPSVSTPSARARFEFEYGRSNDGTKILMVEWEDDTSTQSIHGSWTVSWDGKSHVLPAEERKDAISYSERQREQAHRLLFLLPPGVSIPAMVTLTLKPDDDSETDIIWKTNPLPAIFPPGLNDADVGACHLPRPSKGVLHTLWARKRLQTLQLEIDRESREFGWEGIGLDMALKEKEWIESTFSIPSAEKSDSSAHRLSLTSLDIAPTLSNAPQSPGGSRLSEKLKGLKLQTNEGGLKRRDSSQATTGGPERGPLHSQDEDVAVSGVSAFEGANPDDLASKPAQRFPNNTTPIIRRITPPPSQIRRPFAVQESIAGLLTGTSGSALLSATAVRQDDNDDDGGLFALPLSPRSPEMIKSPFSFAKTDTVNYEAIVPQVS